MPLLLQDQERSHTQVVAAKVLNAALRVRGGFHHDVVQSSNGGGRGNVILGVNCTQVACKRKD